MKSSHKPIVESKCNPKEYSPKRKWEKRECEQITGGTDRKQIITILIIISILSALNTLIKRVI